MKRSYSFSFIASAWHFCDRSVTIKKKRINHWAELSLCGVFCSYCGWKQQRLVNKIVLCGQYWACAGALLQVWDESFATVTSERCRYEVSIFDKNKLILIYMTSGFRLESPWSCCPSQTQYKYFLSYFICYEYLFSCSVIVFNPMFGQKQLHNQNIQRPSHSKWCVCVTPNALLETCYPSASHVFSIQCINTFSHASITALWLSPRSVEEREAT